MRPNRARAIILKEDKILLMKRDRAGEIYYVLPGGGIEDGESEEIAVLREVKEETSLEVSLGEKLCSLITEDGTAHHIYKCTYISGIPALAEDSPELIAPGDNKFTPMWIEIEKIKEISMWPKEVKEFLIGYFSTISTL